MVNVFRIRCMHCKGLNRPATVLCVHCGEYLRVKRGIASNVITKRLQAFGAEPPPPPKIEGDIPLVAEHDHLPNSLYFDAVYEAKFVRVERRIGNFSVGRAGSSSTLVPDIDLTPLKAYERGVSRIHARLVCSGEIIYLQDLNSSNGTRLNGRAIRPMRLVMVNSGATVEFGKLAVRIVLTAP